MNKKNLLPPTYFLIYLLAAIGLHLVLPLRKIISFPYNNIGIIFIGLGILLNIWADRLFKNKNTTVNPFEISTSFIQQGPFRFSRHPMYLGMVFILLGTAVLLGSISPFICVAGFFLIVSVIFIPEEEKALKKAFGRDFINYKKRVRQWI